MKRVNLFFAVSALVLAACARAQVTVNRIPDASAKAVRVVKATVYDKFSFDQSNPQCNMWGDCPFLFSGSQKTDQEAREMVDYFVKPFSEELKSAGIAVLSNSASSDSDGGIISLEFDLAYQPGFYAVIIARPAGFVSRARGYVNGSMVLEVHFGETKGIWTKKKVISDVARKLARAVAKELKTVP